MLHVYQEVVSVRGFLFPNMSYCQTYNHNMVVIACKYFSVTSGKTLGIKLTILLKHNYRVYSVLYIK